MDDGKTIACSTESDVTFYQEDGQGRRYQVSDTIVPLPSSVNPSTIDGRTIPDRGVEKDQADGIHQGTAIWCYRH